MEIKKWFKRAFFFCILLFLVYYVHEAHAVSKYYTELEVYAGPEKIKGQEVYANYEDYWYGEDHHLMEGQYPALLSGEFSKEELFYQENEQIIYGKVKKLHPIVFEAGNRTEIPGIKISEDIKKIAESYYEAGEEMPRKKRNYSACLFEVQVIHKLYGDLEEGRSYWAMVGIKEKELSLKKGDTGLFMIFHNPTLVFSKDTLEIVPTVGNITGFGLYRLSYMPDKNAAGLFNLRTREDAVNYWESHGMFREKENEDEGRKYIDIQGKKVYPDPVVEEQFLYLQEQKENPDLAEEDTDFTEEDLKERDRQEEKIGEVEEIIDGVIEDVKYYIDDYRNARTEFLVRVNHSYRPGLKKGERITVTQLGGYMPYKLYNDYGYERYCEAAIELNKKGVLGEDLIQIDQYGEAHTKMGFSKKGERAIFLLGKNEDYEEEPKEGKYKEYYLVDDDIGKLKYDAKRKVFTERCDDWDVDFVNEYTEKELEERIRGVLKKVEKIKERED